MPRKNNIRSAVQRRVAVVFACLITVMLAGLLVWALFSMPSVSDGLRHEVRENLAVSGVRSEVTAVLLNFRGYDTLLELAVLFTAVLTAWSLQKTPSLITISPISEVGQSLVKTLAPIMLLIAGYILWLGGHSAGGAFQAGVLLATLGILGYIMQPGLLSYIPAGYLRLWLVAGPLVFLAIAGVLVFYRGNLLEYPPQAAKGLIIFIEAVSMASIGAILTVLFAGGRPTGES